MHRSIDGTCTNGDLIRVNICPLNTVPSHPHFINMGVVNDEHLLNITEHEEKMQNSPDGRDVVNFAVSHHGLMALSSETVAETSDGKINLITFLEHAISSQLNGYKLGKALQTAGYDVHLHGHEHENTIIRYDFDVQHYGSIYSSGVAAAYGEGNQTISFSTIELLNPFCMTITNFNFDKSGSEFRSTKSDVIFDRFKSPKNTELAKKEIQEFYYSNDDVDPKAVVSMEKFTSACDKLILHSDKGMFVFGVKLERLREKMIRITGLSDHSEEADLLKKRLSTGGLDFLVVKPIHEEKSFALYDDKTLTADLGNLKNEWNNFFIELSKNTGITLETIKKNCKVRYTNTPFVACW